MTTKPTIIIGARAKRAGGRITIYYGGSQRIPNVDTIDFAGPVPIATDKNGAQYELRPGS